MNEESGFLAAILERPNDGAVKLVYADWLEERGDCRGEYLRLLAMVREQRVVTPEQGQRHNELSAELANLRTQASLTRSERRRRVQQVERQLADLSKQMRQMIPGRLRELAVTFDPNWLAVVSDPEIEGCGQAWRPRFDLVCDKTWAELTATADNTIRHCEACRKNVYYCDNIADAREHSQEGRCIAVDLGVIRRDGDLAPRRVFLGRPSRESIRQVCEEDVDPVSQARLDARRQ